MSGEINYWWVTADSQLNDICQNKVLPNPRWRFTGLQDYRVKGLQGYKELRLRS
ncbi:hypothetical protein MC7420_25 [Coleofasciculus chthonoplastes PCC 7420]|uniref:Uncharacterized protein n=1 Tax=Coleofasciculus chthonoplastes PCC 7420 TaxID=118168 RepID=B4W2U8_9CYAN|nr:hypothetical protein MC7420_25 [Coleofasciculus chthonoplastes PCC 7420]